jgi:hypothetical protein
VVFGHLGEHFETLLEGSAGIAFMGELARQHQNYVVQDPESGFGQGQVSLGNRVKGAGKHAKFAAVDSGRAQEFHGRSRTERGFVGLNTQM